ncbi:MAG: secretin N-terminal domain-containing protein [Verrucomicrobiota bacterium]
MKPTTLRVFTLGLLLPLAALAQSDAPTPAAASTPQPPVEAVAAEAPATIAAPSPAPALVQKGELRLNFQNASLADVLNYLSEAAGFIILQDTPVTGTVNVVSKQPVSVEDAIDLLNSVLIDKGYTAIRNGRVLKIVTRSGAQKLDIPVMTGSDPSQIPHKDGMVTQILPVRYVDATKLVENLRPLLSPDATLNANEASNTLLLADTQTNIRRIAQIISALDTSISSISAIRVFPLQYADSKSLATVLTQLFATDASASANNAGGRGGRGGGLPPWMAAMGGNNGDNNVTKGAAQQAATRVVAVSDDQSNSVVVSAPEAAMATITDIIRRIDTNIADVTETRIFRLEHADATETANVLNSLYSDNGVTNSTGANGANGANRRPQTPTNATNSNRSERSILQARVVAVADPRTNSLLVSASRDSMAQIAVTVGRLDSGDSKKQQVYIHTLDNADPDNVATILRGMFSSQGTNNSTSAQPTSSRLNQRSANGASSDITGVLNTNSTR